MVHTQGFLAALEFKNIWITWEQYPAAAIDCKIVGWHGSILENKEQMTLIMKSILQSSCLASHSDSYKRTEYVVGIISIRIWQLDVTQSFFSDFAGL